MPPGLTHEYILIAIIVWGHRPESASMRPRLGRCPR